MWSHKLFVEKHDFQTAEDEHGGQPPLQRQGQAHGRAARGFACYGDLSAEFARAALHAGESVVAVPAGRRQVEARAVVGDEHRETFLPEDDFHLDMLGVSVVYRVADGLLQDKQNGACEVVGDLPFLSLA